VSRIAAKLRQQLVESILEVPGDERWEVFADLFKEMWTDILRGGAATEMAAPPKTRSRETSAKRRTTWLFRQFRERTFLDGGDDFESFRAYCERYEPRTMKDLAVCCLAYLTKSGRVSPITCSHVWAGMRQGWDEEMPAEKVESLLYGLASRREGFLLENPRLGRNLRLTKRGLEYAEAIGRGRTDGS
jgi:hypothetical protein